MQETDCGQCRELLFDYVTGLTDEADSKAVAAHIESCPECRKELEFIESMLAAAAEIPEVPVPDDVREAVANRLSEAETEIKRNRSKKLRRIVSAAVPIAAAVALTVGMYAGGVFDKFRNADEIMDGKPVPVEDSGAADNKTAEPQTSDNTAEVNPDNMTEAPAEQQSAERGTAAGSKGSSEDVSGRNQNAAETDKTEKAKSGNNDGSANNKSSAAENSDSRIKAEDAADESLKQENIVSAPPAPEASEPAVPTEPAAEDAAEPKSSVYSAPKNNAGTSAGSSGGGASYGANDKNDAAAGTRLMMGSYAEVPKSCEILSDNVKAYAEKFGARLTEGGCSFTISAKEWENLRSFAAEHGDSLSAGEFVSADSIDTISVTVTER